MAKPSCSCPYLLLRRYKPAQPPLTRCYQQRPPAPLPLLPAASPPTRLVRGWLDQPWKVNTAAFLAYAAVSFLPHAALYAICYATSYEEIVPYTNRVHRVVCSPSDERNHTNLAFERLKKEHRDNILGPEDPNTVRVHRMANDIIGAIHHILLTDQIPCDNKNKEKAAMLPPADHLSLLNWEVIILRDKRIMAYNKNGGKIVVHTGMLNYLDTDAEIATVLAHEIGHIVARHVAEISNYYPFPFGERLLPFCRRTEIEADHIGIMLLAAAGFDPRVAPKVYLKLGEWNGNSEWDDYIGTHPSGKTRSRLLSEDKVMEKALELYHKKVGAKEGSS